MSGIHSDVIIRGLLFDGAVNVTAIKGNVIVDTARQAHGLSRVCTAALGRLLMQTAMISVQLKSKTDNITIVLDGDGVAGRFVAVGKAGGYVKGYVDYPETELPLKPDGKLDVAGAVGSVGELRVIRDLSMKEPYVGRSPLVSGEIANDFAYYYTKSEQQPSIVYLGVRLEPITGEVRAAAGLLIQPLPYCMDEYIEILENAASSFTELAKRIDDGSTLENVLRDLFREMDFVATETIIPGFHCDCSRAKLESVLISMGREELIDIIEKDKGAELVCRFCNKKYNFCETDLRSLLNEAMAKNGE